MRQKTAVMTSRIFKWSGLAQIRKQSTFLRHEDLFKDQEAWLVWLRDKFRLKPKPGFPNKVRGCRSRRAETALLNLPYTTVIFCVSDICFRRGAMSNSALYPYSISCQQ